MAKQWCVDRLEEAQAARRGAFRSETDDLMAAIDQAQAECHKAHLDKEALAQQCSELKRWFVSHGYLMLR